MLYGKKMHYKVTYEITNCDCKAGHPLAENATFKYSYIVSGKDPEEAERRAYAKVSGDFIPEHDCVCVACIEYVKPTPSIVAAHKDVGDKPQART